MTISQELNEYLNEIEEIDQEGSYRDGNKSIIPRPGVEEMEDGTLAIYIEYEIQSGGNRASFPEEVQEQTNIVAVLGKEEELYKDSLESAEINEIEEYFIDNGYPEPIEKGILQL